MITSVIVCTRRFHNKGVYFQLGIQKTFSRDSQSLEALLRFYVSHVIPKCCMTALEVGDLISGGRQAVPHPKQHQGFGLAQHPEVSVYIPQHCHVTVM